MNTTTMSGPQHYREAERLLNTAAETYGPAHSELIATAQVHATLAVAWSSMTPNDQRDVEHDNDTLYFTSEEVDQ